MCIKPMFKFPAGIFQAPARNSYGCIYFSHGREFNHGILQAAGSCNVPAASKSLRALRWRPCCRNTTKCTGPNYFALTPHASGYKIHGRRGSERVTGVSSYSCEVQWPKLSFSVYRKLRHTGCFLHFTSARTSCVAQESRGNQLVATG